MGERGHREGPSPSDKKRREKKDEEIGTAIRTMCLAYDVCWISTYFPRSPVDSERSVQYKTKHNLILVPSGASRTGAPHLSERFFTQLWN